MQGYTITHFAGIRSGILLYCRRVRMIAQTASILADHPVVRPEYISSPEMN